MEAFADSQVELQCFFADTESAYVASERLALLRAWTPHV